MIFCRFEGLQFVCWLENCCGSFVDWLVELVVWESLQVWPVCFGYAALFVFGELMQFVLF